MTVESSKRGATTLSHTDFSRYT